MRHTSAGAGLQHARPYSSASMGHGARGSPHTAPSAQGRSTRVRAALLWPQKATAAHVCIPVGGAFLLRPSPAGEILIARSLGYALGREDCASGLSFTVSGWDQCVARLSAADRQTRHPCGNGHRQLTGLTRTCRDPHTRMRMYTARLLLTQSSTICGCLA